ncbi:unnamed protein product [Leptidea sinapis]|uniref:DNA topoisomerase n=1 Tax=Leptidea sinapis TaxID=189913 RepID=A0A5E4PSM1_9NEOP|nr:unnamed protein product [Leptidea sinapis]
MLKYINCTVFKRNNLRLYCLLSQEIRFSFIRNKCTETMKYLNVAEKNDAAKNIALHLSRGTSKRREGLSQYNKIYEFEANVFGQKCQMVMTSVSGHLLGLEFVGAYKNWQSCNPLTLFDAPVFKYCPENYEKIKVNCDREGENIGFEIIDVCSAVKNNLNIYRAKFSEITSVSVSRALQNLGRPDKNISDAVDVRQELDLRIGAAFTRFQTLRLQKVFPSKLAQSLVSYGSCQFPTLGFVVERYRAVENFVLHDICTENPQAKVTDVKTKPKSKWRPLPLDTVELEKSASRKLKINAKETMRLAEKLYTQGLISYPRTETNEFPKEMNLGQLVGLQTEDPNWGGFAQNILDSGGPTPRQGNKRNEQKLYEFIVRSFLACCSKDAQGQETTVTINVANEIFSASGLMITARNYLEVYPYDKWSSKEIHVYQVGQTFNPTSIDLLDGNTSPPNLLTEADLIALMEKHGIVFKCPKCNSDMLVRQKKNNLDEFYISCSSYPACKNAVWLPSIVKTLQFEWRNNSINHLYPPPYTGCIGGCDSTFLEVLQITPSSVRNAPRLENRTDNNDHRVSTTANHRQNTTNSTNRQNSNVASEQNSTNARQANTVLNYVRPTSQPRQITPQAPVNRAQNSTAQRMPVPRRTANSGANFPTPSSSGDDDSNVKNSTNAKLVKRMVVVTSFYGHRSQWNAQAKTLIPRATAGAIPNQPPRPREAGASRPASPGKISRRMMMMSKWSNNSSTRVRGRGRGSGNTGDSDGTRTRKCGLCRQHGHTRNRCPNNAS